MEAASRGAREAGGRVLGIVMNQFKHEPNRFLTDKVATPHFYERLQRLITRSVGFVAIRGGMGTVTELSLVWNKIQTRVIEPRPLVLLGDCWRPVVEQWQRSLAVSDTDVAALDFAVTAEEAVEIIKVKSEGWSYELSQVWCSLGSKFDLLRWLRPSINHAGAPATAIFWPGHSHRCRCSRPGSRL